MSTVAVFLEKALKSVQVCPMIDTQSQRTETRKIQLAQAKTELASVLPVEGISAHQVIKYRIELLERTLEDPTFEERYPYMSMEVLGWRDEKGFPSLVPFSLGGSTFSIEAIYNWGYIESRKLQKGGSVMSLPAPMSKRYDDVFQKLWDWCRKGHLDRCHIISRFEGVIPQSVRKRIQQASVDFSVLTPRTEVRKFGWFLKEEVTYTHVNTNIFLIAEVDNWSVHKLRPDPLVVGYKAGCLWFICSFDETPLEEYVRQEFTTFC